jgi:hypothetical protein
MTLGSGYIRDHKLNGKGEARSGKSQTEFELGFPLPASRFPNRMR